MTYRTHHCGALRATDADALAAAVLVPPAAHGEKGTTALAHAHVPDAKAFASAVAADTAAVKPDPAPSAA